MDYHSRKHRLLANRPPMTPIPTSFQPQSSSVATLPQTLESVDRPERVQISPFHLSLRSTDPYPRESEPEQRFLPAQHWSQKPKQSHIPAFSESRFQGPPLQLEPTMNKCKVVRQLSDNTWIEMYVPWDGHSLEQASKTIQNFAESLEMSKSISTCRCQRHSSFQMSQESPNQSHFPKRIHQVADEAFCIPQAFPASSYSAEAPKQLSYPPPFPKQLLPHHRALQEGPYLPQPPEQPSHRNQVPPDFLAPSQSPQHTPYLSLVPKPRSHQCETFQQNSFPPQNPQQRHLQLFHSTPKSSYQPPVQAQRSLQHQSLSESFCPTQESPPLPQALKRKSQPRQTLTEDPCFLVGTKPRAHIYQFPQQSPNSPQNSKARSESPRSPEQRPPTYQALKQSSIAHQSSKESLYPIQATKEDLLEHQVSKEAFLENEDSSEGFQESSLENEDSNEGFHNNEGFQSSKESPKKPRGAKSSPVLPARSTFIFTEELNQVMCSICQAPAESSHLNYGAYSCFSCRAFFRRSVQIELYPKFSCQFGNQCEITFGNRNFCRSCRFKKCVDKGMKISAVLNLEQKRTRFRKYLGLQEMDKIKKTAEMKTTLRTFRKKPSSGRKEMQIME